MHGYKDEIGQWHWGQRPPLPKAIDGITYRAGPLDPDSAQRPKPLPPVDSIPWVKWFRESFGRDPSDREFARAYASNFAVDAPVPIEADPEASAAPAESPAKPLPEDAVALLVEALRNNDSLRDAWRTDSDPKKSLIAKLVETGDLETSTKIARML